MPSTRRRFLTGVTALTGLLAGCNESTSRAVEETMTPVAVPRTDREILRATSDVDVPSIPPAVVVSDAHLASAIDQLERLRRSLQEAVESRDEPVGEAVDGRGGTPKEIVEHVDERIRRARELGPSAEALDALREVLDDVARPVGYLRAESGELTISDVEAAIEAERSAVQAVRDDLEYRVATPVAEHLPTLHAAEETLHRLDDRGPGIELVGEDDASRDREATSEPVSTPTPDPSPGRVADRYFRLERLRRRRDDAERYLETATDDGAPSVRDGLLGQVSAVRAELEPIADEYGPGEGPAGGGSVRETVAGMRRSVGSRAGRYLSNTPAVPGDGDAVRVLFEGVRQLVSFRAVDAGVSLTLERLDGRRFPAEALLEEKRRAVERVEAAADAPALGRAFAARAPRLLRSGDGRYGEVDPTVEQLARTHVHYVGAGEWAALGVSRAGGLSESLQGQQS